MAPSQHLTLDLSRYEKINNLQAGHIRHFHNLVVQIDGEWHHMGAEDSQQEFFDAFRYQLATMAYAASVGHYYRLPALRSVFKTLIRRLIHKMLHPAVWSYWYLTSQAGDRTDPDCTELRKPWADPIVRENIMYSGHLLLMTSLYAMLFDDDEFEQPNSLSFTWAPMFWGFGPQTFNYDNRSLQKAILLEMERNNWVGVCCEPNVVFIVCNQFPIIAMRLNDVRDGTNLIEGVLDKYQSAWDAKGMVAPGGLFADWLFLKQDRIQPPNDIATTAWASAFLNSWNPELVSSLYDQQILGFVTTIDNKTRLHEPRVAGAYREIAKEEGSRANDPDILSRACIQAKDAPPPPFITSSLGYVVMWLSELGKQKELDGLLEYADEKLQPTWENGGLFYPRNDQFEDENGDLTFMDPFSGNAALAYARLNVKDGQRQMWEKPWTKEVLAARPWIDGITLSQGIDCLRGTWDEDAQALILTMKTWNGSSVTVEPFARNLRAGAWAVYVKGTLVKHETVEEGGSLGVEVRAGSEEVDVVFQKVD